MEDEGEKRPATMSSENGDDSRGRDGEAFEPIRLCVPGTDIRPQPRSRSISRARSQNGYGCDDDNDEDDSSGPGPEAGRPEKDPYEVGWDGGDNDPMCPRRFGTMRKWIIVSIVSSASLCV